jgi:hypothetical protein
MDIDRHVEATDIALEGAHAALGVDRIALWYTNWHLLQPAIIAYLHEQAPSLGSEAALLSGPPAPILDVDPTHADAIARETELAARLILKTRAAGFLSALASAGFEQSAPSGAVLAPIVMALSHQIAREMMPFEQRESLWPFAMSVPDSQGETAPWSPNPPPLGGGLASYLSAMAAKWAHEV